MTSEKTPTYELPSPEETFVEIECCSRTKTGETACGDDFRSVRIADEGRHIAVLSDGLGSGIKASLLSNMTTTMALEFVRRNMEIVQSAEIIMDTLPVCEYRKISYATFTVFDLLPARTPASPCGTGWIGICIFAEVMVKSESNCLTWELLISGQHTWLECPADRLGRRRLLRGAERARDVPETQKKCGRLACLDETRRLKIGYMPIIGLFKARLWALFCCLSEFCGTGYPKPPPRGENGRV